MIYDKLLKISPATNKEFTQGDIINFIQVDSKQIINLAQKLPKISWFPLLLIIGTAMLFYLSYAMYAGIIALVIGSYVNY